MQVLASSGVVVPDHELDGAIDWYCRWFGVQLDYVTQHTDTATGAITHKARLIGEGGDVMEVITAMPSRSARGHLSIGYATFGTDDVSRAYERLYDAVEWFGAPRRMADSTSVAGLDPWGNMVSLWRGVPVVTSGGSRGRDSR